MYVAIKKFLNSFFTGITTILFFRPQYISLKVFFCRPRSIVFLQNLGFSQIPSPQSFWQLKDPCSINVFKEIIRLLLHWNNCIMTENKIVIRVHMPFNILFHSLYSHNISFLCQKLSWIYCAVTGNFTAISKVCLLKRCFILISLKFAYNFSEIKVLLMCFSHQQ